VGKPLPLPQAGVKHLPASDTGFAPFYLLIPRRKRNLTVEGLTSFSPLASSENSPVMVKRAIIQGLKKLIPTVRAFLEMERARNKRR